MKPEQTERVNSLAKELANELSKGKTNRLKAYLEFSSKFYKYSFHNCCLIVSQCPMATNVAGIRAWNKLGRRVVKGAKGIFILAPNRWSRKEVQDDGTERVVSGLAGFRAEYVWDVSQTEGDPLPDIGQVSGDPGDKLEKLEALIRAYGITLEYKSALGGAEGISQGGSIAVLDSLALSKRFHVLVHELAHEMLHRGQDRESLSKTDKELDADCVAWIVSKAIGLEDDHAIDYVQLWGGDAKLFMARMEGIRRCAADILSELE